MFIVYCVRLYSFVIRKEHSTVIMKYFAWEYWKLSSLKYHSPDVDWKRIHSRHFRKKTSFRFTKFFLLTADSVIFRPVS
jgi:hypothetical protein